jgi:ketosteroid isomerase-like protein
MSATRRTILAAAGYSIATMPAASLSALAHAGPTPEVESLLRRSELSNAALMRGDAQTYMDLVALTDDFTLMSPFGGTPSHGAPYTPERIEEIGRFFRNGTFDMEVVATYGSPDLVVLVVIERANVEVGALPAQDWALRVTLVYRREGAEWRLAHRHADPLVEDVSLEYAAAIARGERPPTKAVAP